jgi:hypothetical protein
MLPAILLITDNQEEWKFGTEELLWGMVCKG